MRAIDADALIEKLDAEPEGGYYSPHDVISLLMTQPVVEERKNGKWIYTRPYSAINCSSCHHCSWSMSYEDLVKSFNFCPNCGADMRGGDAK